MRCLIQVSGANLSVFVSKWHYFVGSGLLKFPFSLRNASKEHLLGGLQKLVLKCADYRVQFSLHETTFFSSCL